ncbi:hypothetical protein Taro_026050 [Colocasia esculenta]|uniref:Uncharacterized protein n=1 Tax=Colocasia esculenta TaxID=4460 RepID=A0A843VAZ5_COLES|nr:hypothetical protein [Colocasia esculenta]
MQHHMENPEKQRNNGGPPTNPNGPPHQIKMEDDGPPPPAQNAQHGNIEPRDFMKFYTDVSMWAGALAFGGVMAVLSGVLGNQSTPKYKRLLDACTAANLVAFIFSVFLLLISTIASEAPADQRRMDVAKVTLSLVLVFLIMGLTLATVFLTK